MKLWHGIFSATKDLQSSFNCYGGSVKLVHASLSARKGIEKNFQNCGGPAKLMVKGSLWILLDIQSGKQASQDLHSS